jgi:hypothetical protein
MDERAVIEIGIKSKQGKSESILTARLAVTSSRIATVPSQQGLNVELKCDRL